MENASEATADRRAERLAAIRLRVAINSTLDAMGVTTPAGIGDAVGLSAAEATKLLHRRQWREGDVAALQGIAKHLGLSEHPTTGHWLKPSEQDGDAL